MNFSKLERMVGEGDLSRDAFVYLLNCRGECEWLDYKESLQLRNDHELCDFAKDALAMRNVGGGYVFIGVKDKTWEQVGLASPFPYDTKHLRDQIVRATGVPLELDVVCHELGLADEQRRFALVLVRASKKRNKRRSPTLVAKDFCANLPHGLRRGEIYFRKGDSTVRLATQAELTELLEALEAQADEDALRSEAQTSPFSIEEGTYRLLDKGFETFIGRHSLRTRLLAAIEGDPRIWIVNVHGPGGVGKSALVNWTVHELFRTRNFEAILQLTGKEAVLTDTGIRQSTRSLYSLDDLLDHILRLFEESPEGALDKKKALATELLRAWKTLLVLDNMETVSDGRVLSFVQSLPVDSKARVLLTSRQRTGGWELPIEVTEMSEHELAEFVKIKASEMKMNFPTDDATVSKVVHFSGGLPLATQWILGQYRKSKRLDQVFAAVIDRDSPVLEFSFRNVWNTLSQEAKTVLAIMSILESTTTVQEVVIASELKAERVEEAFTELVQATLVTRSTNVTDGRTVYGALPITLSFSRNELLAMGELGSRARQRLQRFNEQMELQATEIARFRTEFERYGLNDPNEKRAAILCRRAESEMFSGNEDSAELLLKQAHELSPNSAYVLAKMSSFELARGRPQIALQRVDEACSRAKGRVGALCYSVRARVLGVMHDKSGRVEALENALRHASDDPVIRHQYGVALSRAGREEDAIRQFSTIIDAESRRVPPRDTLVMALITRIINLKRLGRTTEAESDLNAAKRIIADYPLLAHASTKLSELENE